MNQAKKGATPVVYSALQKYSYHFFIFCHVIKNKLVFFVLFIGLSQVGHNCDLVGIQFENFGRHTQPALISTPDEKQKRGKTRNKLDGGC